jgi:hypothetical protein
VVPRRESFLYITAIHRGGFVEHDESMIYRLLVEDISKKYSPPHSEDEAFRM